VRGVPGRAQPQHQGQEGQGLVEVALVLPIFLLVIFGLFDVGMLVYTNSTLSQAARESARVASTEAGWVGVPGDGCVDDPSGIGAGNPGAHVCPPDPTSLKDDVVDAANRMAVALGQITAVYVSCNDGSEADPVPSGTWTDAPGGGGNGCHNSLGEANGSSGDFVSVRIEYTHQPITPVIGSLIGSVLLSGSATMIIN